jgi:acyl dehydratase
MRGQSVGQSDWLTVTQQLVDDFARVSQDQQWIQVDPERAKRESPLGTTIAHGFLTVSLLSHLIQQCISFPTARMSLNYGFDRLRFVSPVPVGSQIRGVFALEDVKQVPGGAQITWRADVEIRDAAKPALSALWLSRIVFAAAPDAERATGDGAPVR